MIEGHRFRIVGVAVRQPLGFVRSVHYLPSGVTRMRHILVQCSNNTDCLVRQSSRLSRSHLRKLRKVQVMKGYIFAAHLASPDLGPDHFGESGRVAILRAQRTGARELQMARRRRTV
jgi:hypothetical protein